MSDNTFNQRESSWGKFILISCIVLIFFCVLSVLAYIFLTNDSSTDKITTNTVLSPGKAYLIDTTNIPESAEKCVSGKTYGFNATGGFYTDKGCSGIFVYSPDGTNKRLGVCTTNDTTFKSCTSDRMVRDHYPKPLKKLGTYEDPLYTLPSINDIPSYNSLTGFLDMKDENIAILQQNGKCVQGNYGFSGNNMISVKNGCKGLFVFGPLIGRCDSVNDIDEKVCPIGHLDSTNQGLVLGDIKPFDTSSFCNQGDKYGFKSVNLAFRDNLACQTDGLTFGSYNVKCDDKTGLCDMNRNEIVSM
jgi:hypothetical protein